MIELLLVVTILGIIAAIVVPRVAVSTDNAMDKVQASQISQMNALLEQYEISEGAQATALSDLVPDYLPDGVPVDPHGGTYGIDGTSGRVTYTP